MYFIGCDPDLHCTAIAVVDENGKVSLVKAIKVPQTKGRVNQVAVLDMIQAIYEKLQAAIALGVKCVAVESQEIAYTARQGVNPCDLVMLANISVALGKRFLTGYGRTIQLLMPVPQEWKGSVPKQIHQARILNRVDWLCAKAGSDPKTGYCYPTSLVAESFGLNKGDWKHAVDAIGLALWARDEWMIEQGREARAGVIR